LIGFVKAVPLLYWLARRLVIVRQQMLVVKRYEPREQPLAAIRHVLTNRETENFTYEISNVDELTEFLAEALEQSRETIAELVQELQTDSELEQALGEKLAKRVDRNNRAPYGRRIGWYVTTRVAKPKLVVETGTNDGLGSSVILRALERNGAEGSSGRLISIDVDQRSGWLVPHFLRAGFEQRLEDSLGALRAIEDSIDLAVLDSLHSYDHEREELEIFAQRSRSSTIAISDNPGSHAFADFCRDHGFRHLEFRERPVRHIHPGAGLALAQFEPCRAGNP
jgi:predicted O-methyltransferase YrrM